MDSWSVENDNLRHSSYRLSMAMARRLQLVRIKVQRTLEFAQQKDWSVTSLWRRLEMAVGFLKGRLNNPHQFVVWVNRHTQGKALLCVFWIHAQGRPTVQNTRSALSSAQGVL